ncbi:drug resistance transporter, EmrB/QacA subfamily [Tistlia consotensis]|uniref:Drug resistance transporter, EmrB/QacA subfamily n=1 Tax=Tistlia consotensis USBA 355 TaxID=560819 RepID=A0A1Y6C316_9PROT|nr:MFS transporter [Tistlia consotensis]SMF41179.1 drug resistance transporter, EmrB/QacA subfamily [Tistlia consotensis USBA 355]SNR73956.1 drug resistance transporter, EmrB/QacA subfamily [Tistlia consotensis]
MPSARRITLVVASALFIENLDSTVIATSLPAMALDLGVNPIVLKLAFTAYLVSLAIFIPISGWCADRFGARTVFRAAIGTFILASIGCALSNDLTSLVAARFVQGIGGAMMVPVGRLIILRVVEKRQLVNAMTWLTIPALIAPLLGPPVGGFITTYYHWRWIFWLNVPVGLAGMVLATLIIPQVKADSVPPLDFRGFLLSGLGLSTLIFGFTLLGAAVLPQRDALLLVVVGLTLILLYLRHARRAPHPIIDLKLLAIPTFRASVAGGSLFRIGTGAIPFLLPLMLQLGFGLSPFASGSLTFAAAAGALTMKATAGPILRRFGFRRVLVANALISAGLLGAIALFSGSTPHLVIVSVLLAGGFFRSLQFTSINAIAYADIDPPRMSRATSFAAVIQQLSLAAGVAFAALVLEASQAARGGGPLAVGDFVTGFVAIAALSGSSLLVFLTLRPDAGAEISSHSVATAPAVTEGRGTRG